MGKVVDKTVKYDQLPPRQRKKIMKRYNMLTKKHPNLSEEEVFEKIGRQMNMKIDLE